MSFILFVHNLMIWCSKKNRQNYPEKCFWSKEKETGVKILPRVSANRPSNNSGADPGFFLGGGALVSCSTSTPINHTVQFFFCRIPVVLENRRSSKEGGGAHPLHLPPRSAPATGPSCRSHFLSRFIKHGRLGERSPEWKFCCQWLLFRQPLQ